MILPQCVILGRWHCQIYRGLLMGEMCNSSIISHKYSSAFHNNKLTMHKLPNI